MNSSTYLYRYTRNRTHGTANEFRNPYHNDRIIIHHVGH